MLPQKCGTSTIERRLGGLHNTETKPIGVYYEPQLKRHMSKHLTLKNASKLAFYNERRSYDKVCFVRNPYERVYSWFTWLIRQVEDLKPDDGKVHDSETEQRTQRLLRGTRSKMESVNWDFSAYLKQSPKTFKPTYKFTHYRFRNRMAFIGYVERFEYDYQKMLKSYGIEDVSSANANTSSVPHVECDPHSMTREDYRYLKYYDRSSISIVNQLMKKDFKLFGYEMLNPADFPKVL